MWSRWPVLRQNNCAAIEPVHAADEIGSFAQTLRSASGRSSTSREAANAGIDTVLARPGALVQVATAPIDPGAFTLRLWS